MILPVTSRIEAAAPSPGVAQFFLDASGRIGRAAFAAGVGVLLALLLLFLSSPDGLLRDVTAPFVYFGLFCGGGVVLAKRLHDRGRAGWWAAPVLFAFIAVWPYPEGWRALLVPVLLIAAVDLALLPGQRRFNRFGPAPELTRRLADDHLKIVRLVARQVAHRPVPRDDRNPAHAGGRDQEAVAGILPHENRSHISRLEGDPPLNGKELGPCNLQGLPEPVLGALAPKVRPLRQGGLACGQRQFPSRNRRDVEGIRSLVFGDDL